MPNDNVIPQQNTAAPKQPNWKKVILTIVFILVVVGVVVGIYWFMVLDKSTEDSDTLTGKVTPRTQSSETAKINNDADLEKLENELNNLDIDSLSTDLEGNDKDSADF